jgi:hypothetical protein
MVRFWVNLDFPIQAAGISEGVLYEPADKFSFRAGSYSGYNRWRDQLARIAGFADDSDAWENGPQGKPFYELIHFSDCEGVIGPTIAAKLAKDFADNQPHADAFVGPESDWFQTKYADWRKAFEMASDNGAVSFH